MENGMRTVTSNKFLEAVEKNSLSGYPLFQFKFGRGEQFVFLENIEPIVAFL